MVSSNGSSVHHGLCHSSYVNPPLPLSGARVLVVGTGVSARSMWSWCLRQGSQVVVGDPAGSGQAMPDQRVALRHDPVSPAWLEGIEAVFMSPGIPPSAAGVADLLAAAQARGIPVLSELDLFDDALAQLGGSIGYRPQLVAVTGTNGKTTTTMLTTRLLAAAGRRPVAAGNVGPALMDTLIRCLNTGALPDTWVLELSSFQLSYGHGFTPQLGVLLNITPDHLDWHDSFDEYAQVKMRVLEAPLTIACRDDPVVAACLRERCADVQTAVVTIGSGPPSHVGDYGVGAVAGEPHIVRACDDMMLEPVIPVSLLPLRGSHFLVDVQASLAVSDQLVKRDDEVLTALVGYPGEPHRTEHVAQFGGVDFIDDSKATNVAATLAALAACQDYDRVVLILGGEAKGQDFRQLCDPLIAHVGLILTVGRAAPAIEEALTGVDVPVQRARSIAHAVARAYEVAQPGDVVLLSPACASTDSFSDYIERASSFRAAVDQLSADAPHSAGEVGVISAAAARAMDTHG